jgi:hypothetical protein
MKSFTKRGKVNVIRNHAVLPKKFTYTNIMKRFSLILQGWARKNSDTKSSNLKKLKDLKLRILEDF